MQNALCERQDSLTVVSEIEACVPSLRRYACKLLKTQQDADDLVNDCLVRALGRLPTQWRAPTVRPWLFTIMHNVFVNHVRRSRTLAERVGIDAVGECEVSVEPTQEERLRWRDLIRGLESLSEEQRAVMLLVSVEDLPYADVARVLGIPIGTVMSRLSRGRERLRRIMDGEGPPARRRMR